MNLFDDIPSGSNEVIDVLLSSQNVRIERIVSNGQPSQDGFWYDQDQTEWVMLLCGTATLEFESGERKDLTSGSCLLIPSHLKHRVSQASRDAMWLAVHLLK